MASKNPLNNTINAFGKALLQSQPAFSRLNHPDPATNRVTNDIYDKLQSVGGQVTSLQQQVSAQSQTAAPATSTPAASSSPTTLIQAFRQVFAEDALIAFSDSTVVLHATAGDLAANLPDATKCLGQIFTIKNSFDSSDHVVLGSTASQTVDGVAPSGFVLNDQQAIQVQSDGMNWVVLNLY